ncbi:MAG: LON peptidase substrate-binding domain-containing protein [Bacteroidetes bacterium]|nr:LON peptidase substrate-binding domain-containing protein [Bacteroidota bacterium]MDA1242971.1 LON peptidase substrate-binding domain-containing protein [Bacteroidota bacterium]
MSNMPLFPLSVFPMPGEMIGLHVFEPRFQAMFDELEHNQLEEFGIPYTDASSMYRVGSVMRLITVKSKNPDGSRDVVVAATSLFRLEELIPGEAPTGYPQGNVHRVEDWGSWELGDACTKALHALILDMKKQGLNTRHMENQGLVRVVQHLGITALQKAEILAQSTLHDMQSMLLDSLEMTRMIVNQQSRDEDGVYLN